LNSEPIEDGDSNRLVLKETPIGCYTNNDMDNTVDGNEIFNRIRHSQDGDTDSGSIEQTLMRIEKNRYAGSMIYGKPIKTESFEDDQTSSVVNDTSLINASNYISSDSSSKSVNKFDQNNSDFFRDNDSYLAKQNTSLRNTSFSKRESEYFSEYSDGAVVRNSETLNQPERESLPNLGNSTNNDFTASISEEKEYLKHLRLNSTSDFVTDSDDSVDITKFLS
jgi:hypothetical protein